MASAAAARMYSTIIPKKNKNSKRTHQQHPIKGLLSGTTRVSRYQKGKTNLDFTEAKDSEWQWHQLGHRQICILPQTTMPAPYYSRFLQAGCPSYHQTNSIKALKANNNKRNHTYRATFDFMQHGQKSYSSKTVQPNCTLSYSVAAEITTTCHLNNKTYPLTPDFH